MTEVDYFSGNAREYIKGYVTIDRNNCFAELIIHGNEIKIRLLNFNGKLKVEYPDLMRLSHVLFHHGVSCYLLFGLDWNESSFLKIGSDETYNDYSFSAQGFLYSSKYIDELDLYTEIRIYGENIKKWSGCTRKLDSILECGLNGKLPSGNDCFEFEKKIKEIGRAHV